MSLFEQLSLKISLNEILLRFMFVLYKHKMKNIFKTVIFSYSMCLMAIFDRYC